MLQELRKSIDVCDDEIAKSFIKRMKTVSEIAAYKRENNLQTFDAAREKELKERILQSTDENMRDYMEELFDKILELSKKYQGNLTKNS